MIMPNKGVAVIITRPKPRANELIQLFERKNIPVIYFPTFRIEAIHPLSFDLRALPADSLVIFTSQNAVENSLPYLSLNDKSVISIGSATSQLLASHNIKVTAEAEKPFSSESLLKLPLLKNVRNKKIFIISGEGGRDYLENFLNAQGAIVEKIAVYRRLPGGMEITETLWQEWRQYKKLILTTLSFESLKFLWQATASSIRPQLEKLPLCVMSERQAQQAQELGFHGKIFVTKAASANALFETVMEIVEAD